jgi:hypothetical protein
MKNQGTLIGAPIRINDDQDQYASAFQSEIKGGHHKRTFIADLASFPTHLKEVGMLCYVAENSKTYQLANDLVTWNVFVTPAASGGGGNGTTDPGTGGNTTTATIISGNFGEWTNIPGKSANIFDEQIAIQFKTDLSAFPTRAITYLSGQFGLNSAFAGTEITLGGLPISNRPKARIKKWMACKGVELYLVIETTGAIKLSSKDGFNLPVATAGTENDPYFIDVFFNPDITTVVPTTYTYTRTENFTRNDCNSGESGSIVPFSKAYNSNVSLADAQNIAMADAGYNALGQANANTNGTCTVDELDNNIVNIGVTAPNPQTGANNVFGFKIVSQRPLEEYVTIHFEAMYKRFSGDSKYTDSITLQPGETEFIPGGYPVIADPDATEPSITVLSVTPSDGSTVTEYGTSNKFKLAAY